VEDGSESWVRSSLAIGSPRNPVPMADVAAPPDTIPRRSFNPYMRRLSSRHTSLQSSINDSFCSFYFSWISSSDTTPSLFLAGPRDSYTLQLLLSARGPRLPHAWADSVSTSPAASNRPHQVTSLAHPPFPPSSPPRSYLTWNVSARPICLARRHMVLYDLAGRGHDSPPSVYPIVFTTHTLSPHSARHHCPRKSRAPSPRKPPSHQSCAAWAREGATFFFLDVVRRL
jgi:hypothetical protein